MDNNLTSKEFWVQSYGNVDLSYDENHDISKLLLKYIPFNDKGNCIEIGSFPSNYLPILGKLGYTLNGIDFHPLNMSIIPKWLLNEGFSVDKFYSSDFFNFENSNAYDVVVSFGFIEHFKDFIHVIHKHTDLVKQNGYLVITVPNFQGFFQYILHFLFDRENLKRHNLSAMKPLQWKNYLLQNGFEILYVGYFGNFWFWVDNNDKRSTISRIFIKIIQRSLKLFRLISKSESKHFSAYAGIIAIKK